MGIEPIIVNTEEFELDDENKIEVYPNPATETLTLDLDLATNCLLYTSPSPRDQRGSRMPSSA